MSNLDFNSLVEQYKKRLKYQQLVSPSTAGKTVVQSDEESNNNFWNEVNKYQIKTNSLLDDDIAPVKSGGKTVTSLEEKVKKEEEEVDRKWYEGWFKKGAFADGYQVGDIISTVTGTAYDLLNNFGGGFLEIGEKATDASAYLVGQGSKWIGNYLNSDLYKSPISKKLAEHGVGDALLDFSEDTKDFIAKDLYDGVKLAENIRLDSYVFGGAASLLDEMYAEKLQEYKDAGNDVPDWFPKYVPTETLKGQGSVLGDKSEGAVQSAGQLAGTALLQKFGVPWFVTTGVTSFGSEADSAFDNDASYEEAGLSATITAGAEILTEMISGGVKFGGSTLDDGLTKALSRKIANKTVRTLTKLGVDVVGEGGEEVLSEVISSVGKKMTYFSEKDWNEFLTFEGLVDVFIIGAALGGTSNITSNIKANANGVDSTTGLTTDEDSVVRKEYEDRIAEEEKSGKKLTTMQKNALWDDVVKDMESGRISTDTIESVLDGESYGNFKSSVEGLFGSEDYKTYKDTIAKADAIAKEYEELGGVSNPTLAQTSRFNELDGMVKDINSKRGELKAKLEAEAKRINEMRTKLSGDMYTRVKDSKLGESYRELARSTEKYQADVSKYTDENAKKTIQNLMDSGLANNTREFHDFADMLAKISADKGTVFSLTDAEKLKGTSYEVKGKTVNAFVTDSGDITINIDSKKKLNSLVGHEVTHVLEGTEFYDALQEAAVKYAESKGEYQTRLEKLTNLYQGVKGYETDFDAKVKKELTADLVGDYLFQDKDFIMNLSTENRNLFQKIYDEIKYLWKQATEGSKDARELTRVKKAFEEAYRASNKANANTKYSLEKVDGIEYVKAEKNIFVKEDGTFASERDIFNSLVGKTISLPEGDVKIVKRLPGKDMYNELSRRYPKHLSEIENAKQLNQSVNHNMEELLSNSDATIIGEPDTDSRHQKQGVASFDTRTVKFYDGDKAYDIEFSIATLQSGEKVAYAKKFFGYDAELTKKIQTTEARSEESPLNRQSVSEDKIPQDGDNVKSQFSLSDSNGNQLTQEQNEFFKDSKVRDDNGNLKVMYHGTPNGSFSSFKPGTYFTDNRGYADRYQNPGASSISSGKMASDPKTFEVYLNIKKPFDINDAEAKRIYIEDYIKGGNALGIDPYLSDAEYAQINTIDWTEGEDLRDFLIENDYDYDGLVLDEGGDGGYGDDVTHRGKSYMIFRPEQAKSIDNKNPTTDTDIRHSLSENGETSKDYGSYAVYGEDVKLRDNMDFAPFAGDADSVPDVSPKWRITPEEMFPDDAIPAEVELENLMADRFDIMGGLEYAMSVGDSVTMSVLGQEYDAITDRIRELEAQEAERFDSIDDTDAPPVADAEHYEVADTTPLNKKTVTDLSKKVKSLLGIRSNRTGEVVSMIEAYSRNENATGEQLFEELKSQFGKYKEKTVDDTTKEVKALLRGYRINVSDSIKSEFADYTDLVRRYFGRVRFSKEGMAVDEVYADLSDSYPGYFPIDIGNPANQLRKIFEVADMKAETVAEVEVDDETLADAARTIARTVRAYKQEEMLKLSTKEAKESFDSLMESADEFAPVEDGDIAPVVKQKDQTAKIEKPTEIAPSGTIKTVKERLTAKMQSLEAELANNRKLREESWVDYDNEIARAQAEYNAKSNKNTVAANDLLRRIERLKRLKNNTDANYAKRISDLEARTSTVGEEIRTGQSSSEQGAMRQELHNRILSDVRSRFEENGFDFDDVLRKAKNLSTFATVDNTPQRVMEKALGYKAGQVLSDLTVNKVAQNETEGIKWLNSFTDRKSGVLAQISKQYNIKPGSKESAASQMYAEGFYVNGNNEIVQYGDAELAQDFPNAKTRENIKGLARDPRIRKIYDETLARINESRARNAYPEIQKLDNYFLHFRAMDDTFSRLGIPFNPNDIKAKDLPTDLNGVTADLKPGQPYFASAMHRTGKRTSFDLLGGLERYLSSAKNQIYHIDDIQTLRALRNYVADTYGQAHGLDSLDLLTEEEAQERIEKVYGAHLSTFAKFLNEEANVIAGKTALIDRGLEGVIGRRGMTFLDTVNRQVGSNMVGFNVSSSLTNFLPVAQTFAKTNKNDFIKAFAQTVSNKVGSVFGRGDSFSEESPVAIRRKGEERFYRTPWQKAGDAGYMLMSAVDDISTELIARTKYNEFTRKGMDSEQAHYEADKWVSRLMGDRSIGQQPQLYNSKMLGMITKFQLEVRNQLDSQFYDTIQEAKVSNEYIQNGLLRNAKTAAKVGSTFFQLAVVQHLFGKAFESVAGYNPAFDIISVLIKTFGWDDDEESEDTVLDNIEEGFLELLGDLPYTSTLTGGRIPISSALPVKELVTGKDQYGNEKSRWETLAEAAPYYVLPGGYGQAKKTYQGLSMFDDDLPISGSYTSSGNLRFPVEDTFGNKVQAGLFGQYASENARDYFDNERSPLGEKQIREFTALDVPIREYWEYQEAAKDIHKKADSDKATNEVILKSKYLNSVSDELSDLLKEEKEVYADPKITAKKKQERIAEIRNRFDELSRDSFNSYNTVTIDGDYAKVGDRYFQWYTPEDGEPYWRKLTDEQTTKYLVTKKAGDSSYATDGNVHYRRDENGEWTKISETQLKRQNEVTSALGISPEEYWSKTEISFMPMSDGEYEYAYDNPVNYAVAKSVGGYEAYKTYSGDLYDIKADKDANGKSISGSRKTKVQEYINSLDVDYGAKLILYKSEYPSYDDGNYEIVEYLNGRDDISYNEMVTILEELGMKVHSDGTVTWD